MWHDPLLGSGYSWVLTKLSDLPQELKGILFGFKIFSLLDLRKIGYHKHKTTPQFKKKTITRGR